MSISQEYGRFNIYDVFSTFLPGAITVIGVGAPHPDAASYFSEISLASVLVWGVVAFVTGLIVQIPARALVSGENGFNQRMARVVKRGKEDNQVTEADVDFLETARAHFGFDSDFEDWDRMYRAILTELEQNPPSRAIRLQALFLALRGLVVALLLLAFTTTLYAVAAIFYGVELYLSAWLLAPSALVFAAVALGLAWRAGEFSDDVALYMMTEFRVLYADTDQSDGDRIFGQKSDSS
jgi:hypothetical protein